VAYIGDTTFVSAQGMWTLHPGKKRIVYITQSMNGTFSEGVTYFTDDKTFFTEADVFLPDGARSAHKDENIMVSDDVHKNVSYSRNEDGEWVPAGEFTWTRVPAASGSS